MANPILEGYGKGKELEPYKIGDGFLIGGTFTGKKVLAYDIVSDGRNVALGVKSAAIAGVLTGGVGLLGGAMALKKKRLAVITWSGGEESLVEVRSASLHKALIAASFRSR
jgi:hypothetical protein